MFDLKKVDVTLAGNIVLREIDLHLDQGTRTAVVGPSGSGKSTLLRLFSFMVWPSAGVVEYRGKPVAEYSPTHLRRKVPLVFQEPVLCCRTVAENLGLAFSFLSADRAAPPSREKMSRCLECLELPVSMLDRPIERLSGGEKQRVAIARALCLEPEALLLDEPTSALDMVTAERIFDHLQERFPGLTLVVVTHSPSLVSLTQKQVILRHGRIVSVRERLTEKELKEFLEESS